MGGETSIPYKRLGAWLVRAKNTVYQAATDGFVIGFNVDINTTIHAYTDSANPPVTERNRNAQDVGSGNTGSSISMPVKKNDYWEVDCPGVETIFWIPLEP